MPQISREQLVEDSVFILQCLRQNERGGRANSLDEVRATLDGATALTLDEYLPFLSRFGFVEENASALKVTAAGERAAVGESDVGALVEQFFSRVIAGEPDTLSLRFPRLARVEGEIGQGPLSRVRAARLGDLGLTVAVKEWKPVHESLPWLSREELGRRVRREALQQAQLEHPCVLRILEVSADELRMVMPLAAATLRDKLARAGALPLTASLRLAAQIAHALARAHAQGFSHGALKPENVLLDRAGNALVCDFGAARLCALPPAPQPGPRVIIELNDAEYRAPEVSANEPAGPAADAWALGALLTALLCGEGRRDLPQGLPGQVTELLAELRERDPARRPALAQVAQRLVSVVGASQLFLL